MDPLHQRPGRATLLALLSVPLIGTLDLLTGVGVLFTTFYMVPIILAAWSDGRWGGLLVAAASTLSGLVANHYLPVEGIDGYWVPYWNSVIRILTFAIVSEVVWGLRRSTRETSRLASIVESALDGILGLDDERRITSCNTAAEQMFGRPARELVGLSMSQLLPRMDGEWAQRRDSIERGERVDFVEAVRRPDGSLVQLSVVISPICHRDGILGYAVNARDITERHQAAQALQEAKAELERSNADLEAFAYVASHDLRDPLRLVTSYTQLLLRRYGDRMDDAGRRFGELAVSGCDRMRRMLDALLDYSRVGSQGARLEPVDPARVLEDAIANLQVLLRETGGRVDHGSLPVVHADRDQLLQVFQNLIANALKFRRPEVPPVIEVRAEPDGHEVRFSVHDNGIGIPPERQARIFDLFERLERDEHIEGTGIGLAIVKRIVERHGGRIGVTSSPAAGTTFWFTLPRPDALRKAA